MGRKPNLTEVLREIFALSGNKCAFPNCNHQLINEEGIYVAQICHIEAANPKGQRYNPDQNDEERRYASNLLLLCHEHHKVTDDVTKYTVDVLKQMKKEHEDKYRKSPYIVDENIIKKIVTDLRIKLDELIDTSSNTNTIVRNVDQKLDQLIQQVSAFSTVDNEKLYIAELDAIKELRKQGKVNTVIEMLLNYKTRNWPNLTPETKYKVIGNLANCYLALNKKKEYYEVTKELDYINLETPESISLRILGCAVVEDYVGFDALFEKAVSIASNNVNLWVAYIIRHKENKTTEQLLSAIPTSVVESGNITFHIGQLTIEEGRKKEGIELIKKAISKLDPSEERLGDSSALIATYLIQDLVQPQKFLFNTYTEEETMDLIEARNLLTESWDHIKNTELASSKSYIILNRGVVNKILGRKDEAITDFQKAFELSAEFKAYQNLLIMYIDIGNLSAAEALLSNPNFTTELSEEEKEINKTFRARFLIQQGKFKEAIEYLEALITKEAEAVSNRDLYGIIIATCLHHKLIEEAKYYVAKLINAFPEDPNGYIFSGIINLKMDKIKALEDFDKAASLLKDSSPINLFSELASGYSDLGEYEKAIPQYEKIANKSVYNDFTKGLIYALYQAGYLDKSLNLANKLYETYQSEPFLAEIIGNIYNETKRFDEAIRITESFHEKSTGNMKDFFSFRLAKMYSYRNDWSSVRRTINHVQSFRQFSLDNIFALAYLLLKSGEKDKAMIIAYEARTKYYDHSEAHLKYINLSVGGDDKHSDLFPDVVTIDCAIFLKTENGNDECYLITEKNTRGENVLKPSDNFAQKLIGKKVGDELVLRKGFGIDYKVSVTGIMTIYVHAFRESLRLFETRFAGMHGVGVFRANPGQPDDQIEQVVKGSTLSTIEFKKQVDDIYSKRIATIGVVSGLFKRNVVRQWMIFLTSQEVNIYAYSQNEFPVFQNTIEKSNPLVLDITSLLTNFFMLPDAILFPLSHKEIYVVQSTIDELQEFHDEMKMNVDNGMLSLGYQDGQMVSHSMTANDVIKQLQKISDIIQWCKNNVQITSPSNLIKIKRNDRQKRAQLFGDCFYDSALLARELNATMISDDDTFKKLLTSEYGVNSFSTFQLALSEVQKGRISNDSFEKFTIQLIICNYVYLPINAEILWKIFDLSGFMIRKPFTTALKGLHIMVPEIIAAVISAFFKKLYLEAGLTTTREQTVLSVIGEIHLRPDFQHLKKLIAVFVKNDFKLMQPAQKSIVQLLNCF